VAKTYEFVVYDDDGAGVTSAITEYDRVDGGQLSYVGCAWLDVDETTAVLDVVADPGMRRQVARMVAMVRGSDALMAGR
jgi:hypothetical protein